MTLLSDSANHVGGATVTYGGVQRHYIVGGQDGLNENGGNKDSVYEYISSSNS
jgi:hypothetical protein